MRHEDIIRAARAVVQKQYQPLSIPSEWLDPIIRAQTTPALESIRSLTKFFGQKAAGVSHDDQQPSEIDKDKFFLVIAKLLDGVSQAFIRDFALALAPTAEPLMPLPTSLLADVGPSIPEKLNRASCKRGKASDTPLELAQQNVFYETVLKFYSATQANTNRWLIHPVTHQDGVRSQSSWPAAVVKNEGTFRRLVGNVHGVFGPHPIISPLVFSMTFSPMRAYFYKLRSDREYPEDGFVLRFFNFCLEKLLEVLELCKRDLYPGAINALLRFKFALNEMMARELFTEDLPQPYVLVDNRTNEAEKHGEVGYRTAYWGVKEFIEKLDFLYKEVLHFHGKKHG